MKKNRFLPILVLAIVIVVAGVSYFGYKNIYTRPHTSQVNVDTINWKTYQNIVPNFSFKYPEDFTNKTISKDVPKYEEIKLFSGNRQYSLQLRVSNDSKTYNIENLKTLSVDQKQLGSSVAYLDSFVSAEGWFTTQAIIPINGYFIDISVEPIGNTPAETEAKSTDAQQMLDQILSTFKVTK
jgi:hypothetical protein